MKLVAAEPVPVLAAALQAVLVLSPSQGEAPVLVAGAVTVAVPPPLPVQPLPGVQVPAEIVTWS